MAAKHGFSFEDLQAYCRPGVDIERFRDGFDVLFDVNGVVASYTVGFHFDFDDEDPSCEARFLELVKLFQPTAIWGGSTHVVDKVKALGRQATLFPFFEDGGFMVVLKVPVRLSRPK